MKQLYRYKGPAFIGSTIFRGVDEHVHAYSWKQAITIIRNRICSGNYNVWLKPEYLEAVNELLTV